jgi:hypothetical protein
MNSREFSEETRTSENMFRFVSYALVTLMMTCAVGTLVSLINRLFPDWQPWYIAGLSFFVVADRLYTYRPNKKLPLFSKEWFIVFGSQGVLILLIVKVAVGLSHGVYAFWAEIQNWWPDFVMYFLNYEYLTVMVIMVVIWLVSGYFAELLDEMGLDQALVAMEIAGGDQVQGPPARVRLVSLIDLRSLYLDTFSTRLVVLDLAALAGGGASTLLYFMFGMALLSQTQFVSLHTRWSLQKIPINRNLAGRWALYSILFLVLLAIFTSLLPTHYSLGMLSALGKVLDTITQFLISIAQFFVSIILLIISLPFMLLGKKTPLENVAEQPTPTPTPTPSKDLSNIVPSPAWLELTKSLIFWVIFLSFITYSIILYLRQHKEVLESLRKIPGWRLAVRFLNWIKGIFIGAKSGISRAVKTGRERLLARRKARQATSGSGFLNLRRLDPRQKVYFFYLALIRRGTEIGMTRKPAQTPTEYAATLESALPTVDEDIDALTEAFIEARYSRHPVEPEKANLVKATWERIRKALQQKRQ